MNSCAISKRARANQRGAALIFALMVLFILSMGTSVLWKQLHSNLDQQRRSWHREQAFQLAEAGLEHAIAGLRASGAAYEGAADVPLGAGTYSVSIAPGDTPGEFALEAWGRLEPAPYNYDRAGLRGRVRLENGQVTEYAWEPIRGKAQ